MAALEPLVTPHHGLPKNLQEQLIHIVLNHERHCTSLSVRALRSVLDAFCLTRTRVCAALGL